MEKKYLLLTFLIVVCMDLSAHDKIDIHQTGQMPTHIEHFIPADQPDVYYDNVYQTITIDGGGEVTYYDVEIASVTTTLTVISTQVNGFYDTIDVSSLPQDEYVITIYSPEDHTYEGFFEVQ